MKTGSPAEETATQSLEPIVYVVDDDQAVRDVVRWLIQSVGLHVETFSRATEFLERYRPDRPACLLLDVRMPGMSGLDLQSELAARKIDIPVIVVTGYAEVPTAVRALRAGAFDFIEKPFSEQALLDRVRQALEVDAAHRQTLQQQADVAARLARLTPRQREVLEQLLAGKPSKVIAADLGLSPKTVDVHRAQIMERLEARSLAQVLLMVIPSAHAAGPVASRAPAKPPVSKSSPARRKRDV